MPMPQDTKNNNNKNKEYARTRCVHVPFAINPESKKHKKLIMAGLLTYSRN